mmetsp:Transcript_16489/g.37731  ORF Transcript_16489/g.37731 Transcript_16489/m.37731 type:complete len:107 (-) Transcript_16489:8-328(-)
MLSMNETVPTTFGSMPNCFMHKHASISMVQERQNGYARFSNLHARFSCSCISRNLWRVELKVATKPLILLVRVINMHAGAASKHTIRIWFMSRVCGPLNTSVQLVV